MRELILAHDLGTTGNKATLFDASGNMLRSAFAGYDTAYPQAGWAEQDPADWWRAVCRSSQQLLGQSGRDAREIAVISFSGEMMSCLPVDEAGRPLRSAIIWADQRADREAATIVDLLGAERTYRLTGHRASASYTAAKLLWVRTHQPEIYAHTHKVLQAKDYVAYRLTGVYATDYSDASGTNLFDLRARSWSEEILAALEIPPSLLPPAHPSASVIGAVTREAADCTGLAERTPVVIGSGDGACATAGAGVLRAGDAYTYIGSSAWTSYVSQEPLYDPLQRTATFAHLDPAYVFPTGSMQAAGGAYDWLERLLRDEGEERIYAQLDEMAAGVPPGAKGLLCLPYFIGERSPHWNPRARAAYIGLTMAHGRAEIARATLEGVALNLRAILEVFREQGAPIAAMRIIGGGARSPLWRQIVADVFNLPLLRPRLLVQATSLGAAIAGAVGVGLLPDYASALDWVRVEPGEEPQPEHASRYDELYPLFLQTYRALVPLYDRLAVW
jgi:xylulokinase